MIDAWNLEIMARTIYGEARGESLPSRAAVGKVILNRQKSPRWPHTIAEVCLQPYQFSCWNSKDPNRAKIIAVDERDQVLCDCRKIAELSLSQYTTDLTEGANHYFTTALIGTDHQPSWYDPAKVTAQIGAHVFLKL